MPYIETITTPSGLHIATWHLVEDMAQLTSLWGATPLPERLHNVTAEKRRREILATHLLMRHIFGCDIPLWHTPEGAPCIDKGYISVSHTTTHVAVAYHPHRRVGIDIETVGTKATRVYRRFLSDAEITSLPDDGDSTPETGFRRTLAIHTAWSVKEALYKIYPHAVEFREDIILDPFTTLPHGTVTAHIAGIKTPTQARYAPYHNCTMAWAEEGNEF